MTERLPSRDINDWAKGLAEETSKREEAPPYYEKKRGKTLPIDTSWYA